MGLPADFWAGWFVVLAVVTVVVLAYGVLTGATLDILFGMCLGFAFVGFVTWCLMNMSFKYLLWAFIVYVVIGFARLTLIHDRAVYKWTNGRPDGER